MENIHKVGAIGIPGYDWEVKIIDDKVNLFRRASRALCKGPGVMKCYYNDPKATEAVLREIGF